MLLATACGRIGFDAQAEGTDVPESPDVDAGTLGAGDAAFAEPAEIRIDRVAPDAIYGSFSGFDAQVVTMVEVLDTNNRILRTLTELPSSGDRFAILLGDETLAGQDVSVRVLDANSAALVESTSLRLPDPMDVTAVDPRDLHLSYFTDEFYIGLVTAGTHCLDLIGEDGQVHTSDGCLQFNAEDNLLVDLAQLSGTIDIRARYSLCETGGSGVTACSSLELLRNNMAVDRLVLDTANSVFSIELGGNLSACIRIMDENQTQILLNDSASPHACVGTYISGYTSQDIPLSELSSAIDPALQYAICNIDGRGLAYSVCTPLATLEMP